jgi:hypothetical protein
VGFEPDGAEVVSAGEADVGVESGGEAAQERNGGFGAAFLDALDVVVGQGGARGQVCVAGPRWSRSQVFWLHPAGAELDLKCFKFPILVVWTRTG